MSTSHTPIPWEVIGRNANAGLGLKENWRYTVQSKGRTIYESGLSFELHWYIDGSGQRNADGTRKYKDGIIYTQEQAKLDAEFIVLAANHHEALVNALQRLMDAPKGGTNFSMRTAREHAQGVLDAVLLQQLGVADDLQDPGQ